ncbi:MAG: acetoacetate--CoA ligase [Marmoricola sp.]
MVAEGELLWTPSEELSGSSNVTAFMTWLAATGRGTFEDYDALWRWSTSDVEGFWEAIWEFFEVESSTPYKQVVDQLAMPGSRWFEGSQVNYAEHLLRRERIAPDEVAVHHSSELRPMATMTWRELAGQVRIVATKLRELGVKPGDRVVAYTPTVPETLIAMAATMAIGAVWSSAAPEFGVKTVTDRFGQIEPTVLFAADGYRFAGKDFTREQQVRELAAALPTLRHVVWLSYLDEASTCPADLPGAMTWVDLVSGPEVDPADFHYERVGFDHPMWVLFSSGTTGLPKAIVHGHVGVLVEHLKVLSFHLNLRPGSTMFFYTTTGWMMFNLLSAALLTGSAIVLYDGNPAHPKPDQLFEIAAETGTTSFGASPTFVQLLQNAGLRPGEAHDLSRLEGMMVAGAPATPETFSWCYENVRRDLWVSSQSGGTEICSGFVAASPTLPVYAGEIQTRALGMDVHSWSDAGAEVVGEVGELVVTKPFPSMPLYFWGDDDGSRYHEAYFDVFPGVWRHGDFLKVNERGGCYIYGRSDSTLNRFGVRIGTAEVYRTVEQVPGVKDSLIVCLELPGGNFFMPLFVSLEDGTELNPELVKEIADRLRRERSPRHVPDTVYAVPAVPYTLTGKKMEIPVRKVLLGLPLEKAASRDAMANPDSLDWFIDFAATSTDYERPH